MIIVLSIHFIRFIHWNILILYWNYVDTGRRTTLQEICCCKCNPFQFMIRQNVNKITITIIHDIQTMNVERNFREYKKIRTFSTLPIIFCFYIHFQTHLIVLHCRMTGEHCKFFLNKTTLIVFFLILLTPSLFDQLAATRFGGITVA